jgi:hypothetical protein
MAKKNGGGKPRGKPAADNGLSTMMIGGAVLVIVAGLFYSGGGEAQEAVQSAVVTTEPERKLAKPKFKHTTTMDYDAIPGDEFGNKCKDTHVDCGLWAEVGECDKNPSFMITGCPRSCETCALLDVKVRCKRDPDAKPAIEKGGLGKMFNKIKDGIDGEFADLKPKVLSEDPWIIYFDEFVTPDEIDETWRAFNESGATFTPSLEKDTGDDGVANKRRTSWSTQCNEEKCYDDKRVLHLHERVKRVTNLPVPNQEFIQLVKVSALVCIPASQGTSTSMHSTD